MFLQVHFVTKWTYESTCLQVVLILDFPSWKGMYSLWRPLTCLCCFCTSLNGPSGHRKLDYVLWLGSLQNKRRLRERKTAAFWLISDIWKDTQTWRELSLLNLCSLRNILWKSPISLGQSKNQLALNLVWEFPDKQQLGKAYPFREKRAKIS